MEDEQKPTSPEYLKSFAITVGEEVVRIIVEAAPAADPLDIPLEIYQTPNSEKVDERLSKLEAALAPMARTLVKLVGDIELINQELKAQELPPGWFDEPVFGGEDDEEEADKIILPPAKQQPPIYPPRSEYDLKPTKAHQERTAIVAYMLKKGGSIKSEELSLLREELDLYSNTWNSRRTELINWGLLTAEDTAPGKAKNYALDLEAVKKAVEAGKLPEDLLHKIEQSEQP